MSIVIDLVDWLLGISESQGGRERDGKLTQEYAKLIGEAKMQISIVSGNLPFSVYTGEIFMCALDSALKRGATVKILAGPTASKDSINQLRQKGVDVLVLRNWPERHFALVDDKHVRVEDIHAETSTESTQYIIHNYKLAYKLKNYFDSLAESNNGSL